MEPKLEYESTDGSKKLKLKNTSKSSNQIKEPAQSKKVDTNQCITLPTSPSELVLKLNQNNLAKTTTSSPNAQFNPLMYSFVTFEGKLNLNYITNKIIK